MMIGGYWEDYWINQSKIWGFELLNKMDGGHGYGKHDEETIEKIRKSQSGKNNAMYGKPSPKGFLGKIPTEEHRRKISEYKKNHKNSVGEKNPKAKLTRDNVIEIKSLLNDGISPYKIAKGYDVSPQSIYNIKKGKTWISV